MRTPTSVALVLLLGAIPCAAPAQENLFPQASVIGGVETRQYNFGENFGADYIRQIAFPVAVLVPVGKRFSFDIGSNYAITSVGRPKSAGGKESFSDFTDTQLRGSYVFGRDVLVASVMMNLPTGPQTTTLRQFSVASSASSNFLLFPVNTYGSGFSVTPGLALAATAGDWNLGLAGSVRVSATYSPFNDSNNQGAKYQPGVETRLRAGVDRLVGSSRLTVGFTFSTFSNDELRGGSFGNGAYDPGDRFLVDVGVLAPAGGGTIGAYVWNYYRSSSGSSGAAAVGGKENVFTGGLNGNFPLSSRVALEPVAEARLWSPEDGKGSLFGVGTSLRFEVGPRVWLIPGGRVDYGRLRPPQGKSDTITGWSLGLLLRYGL
ncbi:MAG TPA: hypothetical protein VH879_01715 [Gemmatimonadales bacterium]|jgi:hypothetical protein